jgi:anti-sigma-K factor RskA
VTADDPTPVEELLGAYALDAVDDHERRQVEAYLRANPEARAEVEGHREVAALLATTGDRAPVGVWDRIADALEGRAPRPGPALAAVLPARRSAWRVALVASAAAAVVAAAVAITVVVRDDTARLPVVDDAIEQAYGEAWADPAARRVRLVSEDDTLTADAVVEPAGVGFLSAGGLPELPTTETYQLWGVYDDGDVISLGVLGSRPAIEPFTAEGNVEALVITRERAGGVVSSTSGALLVGDVS